MVNRLGSIEVFPPAGQYVYLDAASVGLSHTDGANAISNWQKDLAERGTVAFTEQDEVECLDNLNDVTARLFNAKVEDIATASSETVLMLSLTWAVMPQIGSNIVSNKTTHPSTVYPWMRVAEHTGSMVRWAKADASLSIDPDELESLIDDDTSVVCLSHVEWGSGQVFDFKRFADTAYKHGAICVVDATQSAGQIPIDVQATVIMLSGGGGRYQNPLCDLAVKRASSVSFLI